MTGRGIVAGLLLLAATAAAAPAQEEIVERGNQLYQSEDYAAAAEAWEAVLAGGFESAELHYNLGNAYFKRGDLGLAILSWERSLVLAPGDADALANLALADGLTADEIQPLPRFWVLSVVTWWVDLVPRTPLLVIVAAGWLALAGGLAWRILSRDDGARVWAGRTALAGAGLVIVLGVNLVVRESGAFRADRGVVLADVVPVRSAPAEDDNLTLFEVHEGTRVRIDRRAGEWAEIVLDDGKVGWVPLDRIGVI